MSKKRISAWLLSALIMLSVTPSVSGEETVADDNNTIEVHISTAEELEELSEKCRLDSYSRDITVILDNDINLNRKPFSPIPSFGGVFEGNSHKIYNFVNAEEGSNEGLFRYIEETGEIRNLNVDGMTVTHEGGIEIGGIAGTNYGLIENCTFNGTVSGREQVGGICGANYGKITNCTSYGTVSGKTMVGGICGYNNCSIYNCLNRATVNPALWEEDDSSVSELDGLNLSNLSELDIVDLISASSSNTTSDVGGIAGYSDYIIYVCVNRGNVGYPSYGYNIGGIAGRQSNFISKCTNYGSVTGRNDVGGIVGQNEPYMDLTDRMTIAGEIQALSDNFENTTETLSDDTEQSSGIISNIGSDTESAFEYTQSALNDAGKLDALEEDIEDDYGVSTELNDLDNVTVVEDEQEEEPDAADVSLDVSDVRSKADEIVGNDTADRIISGDVTEEDISQIAEVGTDKGSEVLSDSVDSISARRAARKAEEAAEQNAFVNDVTNGGSAVVSMGSDFSALGQSFRSAMTNLTGNLEVVNEHFSNIMTMLTNALAGNFNADIMQDISEYNDTDSMYGTVTNSVNYGTVDGDRNVGGIAGSMSIESELDLEGVVSDNLASNGLFSNTYETTCIIRICVNKGTVSCKHDNTGGIAGKQDMGLIINSENYGDVTGSGNYTGGVTGLSYSTVNTCYSKCTITGNDYTGGIAGSGSVLYECISLSTIANAEGSFIGAIAGYADMDAERQVELESGMSADVVNIISDSDQEASDDYNFVMEKCVTGNYFVNDGLGGVNGISYKDLAEPVTYKEAMEFSGLPEELNSWTVIFRADGEKVEEVEFEYGGSLTSIPPVPVKDGYTGIWEDFETENLTASRTVDAIYIRNGNAVEGSWVREETGVCAVLLEGPLDDRAKVDVYIETSEKGARINDRKVIETVTVQLTDAASDSAEYKVHYQPSRNGTDNPEIYILDSQGQWQQIASEKQGSYLLFSSRVPLTFAAVEPSHTAEYILIGVAVLAVLATAAWIYNRRTGRWFSKKEKT